MFSFLEGVPHDEGGGVVSIDVSGTGYKVFVPKRVHEEVCEYQKVRLWTHTIMTDKSFTIFGFTAKIDRGVFLSLLKVPGIGPKKALGVLGKSDGGSISKAIVEKDTTTLSSYGISTQQAERIVLELTKSLKGSTREGFEHLEDLLVSLGYSKKEASMSIQGVKDKDAPLSTQLQHALRYMHAHHI